MITGILHIVLGLVLLYFGAEWLVRASSALATRMRISPLIIGLTFVAFGTSMPEMMVSIKTSLAGQGAISVGNVVGSNIFNIAIILGISAIIYPLKAEIKLIKIDTPIMIATTMLFFILFLDTQVSRFEGIVLFLLIVLFTLSSFYFAKREKQDAEKIMGESDATTLFKNVYIEIVIILGSLLLLVFGANNLVSGAISIANKLGVSQAIIGLTIIAAGTSLPELATSVIAALRKSPDIAIGNVVGSNIFNIFGDSGSGVHHLAHSCAGHSAVRPVCDVGFCAFTVAANVDQIQVTALGGSFADGGICFVCFHTDWVMLQDFKYGTI